MPTPLNNQASVTYTYQGSTEQGTANSNITTTTLLDPYSMTAVKIPVFTTFRNGDRLTYLIPIRNTGTGTLYNVTISDNLGSAGGDPPTSYFPDSAYVYADGKLTALVPKVAVGTVSFSLPCPISSGQDALLIFGTKVDNALENTVSSIRNTATVTATGGSTSGTLVTVTPAPTATVTREQYADLSIYKQADKSIVQVGDTLTYTFTLTNTGSEAATGVTITDILPAGFSVSSVSLAIGGQSTVLPTGSYALDTGTNTLTVPTKGTVSITVPAMSAGTPGVAVLTVSGTIVSQP